MSGGHHEDLCAYSPPEPPRRRPLRDAAVIWSWQPPVVLLRKLAHPLVRVWKRYNVGTEIDVLLGPECALLTVPQRRAALLRLADRYAGDADVADLVAWARRVGGTS